MQGTNIDFGEGLILFNSIGNDLALPLLPRALNWVAEVIESVTGLREFYLCHAAPERVEFFLIFLIILATSNRTSKRPHACKYEESFVSYFLKLFIRICQNLSVFDQKCIKNRAQGLYHHNIVHRWNMLKLIKVSVEFNVLLEVSVEYIFADIINVWHDHTFILSR